MSAPRAVLIVGGAGFIGSHFTDRLLASDSTERVTLYDNFSSGQEWHYEQHANDDRLNVVRGDANDLDSLTGAMQGHDFVIHLASNPDIAAAMTDPTIDFHEGTKITHHVAEAVRLTGSNALHTHLAVASMAILASSRRARIMVRCIPSRHTAPASSQAKRSSALMRICSNFKLSHVALATSWGDAKRMESASISYAACSRILRTSM